jgi:hypothetical protein
VGYGVLKNWFVPEDWGGPAVDRSYVLTVRPFEKGGYEATVRALDLDNISRLVCGDRRLGVREVPDVVSVENQEKAAQRAKRKMRYLVRNMMADHLVTLTKRESVPAEFWTPEDWARAWDRCRRALARLIGDFPYVAILEQHAKGNYHLHIAWCGRVAVRLVRSIWLAVIGGGPGCGNIDARHMRVSQAGGDRATRIARYISKYVGKHFEDGSRFNKKRYWASRQTLAEARRYVLRALSFAGAVDEVKRMLGLDLGRFQSVWGGKLRTENLFLFPDGCGLWLNYIPELHGSDPPF